MTLHHWLRGPFMVHPGRTEHCFGLWCTVFGRHEHYGECACGYTIRTRRLKDCSAALHAHLDEIRRQRKDEN